MKKFRMSAALLLLAWVMALVPATFAQDSTFGASQEDFDLWTAANEALTTSAASIDFTATVAATGLGEGTNDVNANITGKGAFDLSDSANPLVQLDITGTMTEGSEETPVNLNLRIVDGVVYTNQGDGWKQEPLEDQLSELTGDLGSMTGSEVDPSDLSASNPLSMFGDIDFSQFISLDVSDDSGSRKFSLGVDIGGFFSSPAILQVMTGAMGMGGSDASMSEEQLQTMGQQFAALFGDASITFDEWINAETQALNRAVLDISFPLDAMMGPGAGISLNLDVALSNHGASITVEAPEGAVAAEGS